MPVSPAFVIHTITLDVELGEANPDVPSGVNVSRIVRRLGRETLALGFVGSSAPSVRARLDREDVPYAFDDAIDASHPSPGITLLIDCLDNLKARLGSVGPGGVVILSGLLPKRWSEAVYGDLCRWMRTRELRPIVDASGPALVHALESSPFLIKPSVEEAEDVLGCRLEDDAAVLAAAHTLRRRGAEYVVISQGAGGAIGVGADGAWKAKPPHVGARNGSGKGDAMVAGLAIGFSDGRTFAECLQLATAAAAAAVAVGAFVCDPSDVALLMPRVAVRELELVRN